MNTFIRNHRKILKYGHSYSENACKFHKSVSYPYYKTHYHVPKCAHLPSITYQHIRNSSFWLQKYSIAVVTTSNTTFPVLRHENPAITNLNAYHQFVRNFTLNTCLYENVSKVEASVQCIKNKQKEKVEKIMKDASVDPSSTTEIASAENEQKAVAKKKKSWKTRIWEECLHYYHGFRLLFIDINVSRKLVWRILMGKTLTRRENNLLVRTTSDMFRLIPFSVFIIVPFLELLLPFFIKFFPGMLPSTFQTAKDREDKLKQSLQVRLEIAKFFQKTLDNMAVIHKDPKSDEAKEFAAFFKKIRNPNENVSNEEIIMFAKRFDDEITLDSLTLDQLSALCRLLELNTMGTSNLLRFQLRMKLRSLRADDRVIAREGVNSLDLFELQQACKARGMRAYGLTAERLRSQLQEWIDLSLNEKVPPTLLLLSRAMLIPDEAATTDKLKETIRVLPDTVGEQTQAAICELQGKIDNKAKIAIIKEEERRIKAEREEECEEEKSKKELLSEQAIIATDSVGVKVTPTKAEQIINLPEEPSISPKDVNVLSEALKALSTDKKMAVEKETIKEIKEDLEEYKEDLEELREVRSVVQEPIHESRAAKILFKKVNNMLCQLDNVLSDLEKKQQQIQKKCEKVNVVTPEEASLQIKPEELVHIDELMSTIKRLQQTSDETRLKQIETFLSKIDDDKDGVITIEEVLKVVHALGRENVHLSEKQIEELITLLDKEELIEAEEKIEKAIAKSIKEAEAILAKKKTETYDMENIECLAKKRANTSAIDDTLKDAAVELKDNAKNMDDNKYDKKNEVLDAKTIVKTQAETELLLKAAEQQKDKILPSSHTHVEPPPTTTTATAIPPTLPPTIPPPPTTTLASNQSTSKEKLI